MWLGLRSQASTPNSFNKSLHVWAFKFLILNGMANFFEKK